MREIHDLGGLVDKDEAKRDQAVDAAERNTTHQLLNEVQHCRRPSPDASAILMTALPHPAAVHFSFEDAENLHMTLMPIQPKAPIPVNKALVAVRVWLRTDATTLG